MFFEFFKNIECFFSIKVGHLITLLQILYKLMPGYITVGVSEGEKLATILLYPNDKYSIDYSFQHCVSVLKRYIEEKIVNLHPLFLHCVRMYSLNYVQYTNWI